MWKLILSSVCVASLIGFAGVPALGQAAKTPTEAELTLARRILEATVDGVGVLDGKMVDVAHVRWARRILGE